MAFPSSSHHASHQVAHPLGSGVPSRSAPQAGRCGSEGDHQLEKLEFALAVALTRGDDQRSQQLRDQIAALGGNQEEPGT